MTSTQAWVTYLSRVELPVLANSLRRINELTDSSSSTVNQLAEVILNDAQLTSQVLRLSNTVFYNQTRTQVSTVSRAITLVGFDAVKSMAISSLLVDNLLQRSARPHLLRCLARAIHGAVQARCLLPRRNDQALEEVFIGALLMNIGELAFWACDTEQAAELESRLKGDESATVAQKAVLHTTFVEITRGLAEAWALGPFIKDVVAAGKANSPAASLVRHASEMARASEQGWRGPEMDRILDAIGQDIGETPSAVRDQVKVNAGEAAKIAVFLGLPQVTALMPGAQEVPVEQPPVASTSDPGLQLEILRKLTLCLTRKPEINEVCQLAMEGIQHGVGMQRVVLLMADRGGRQLVPRKVAGADTGGWREDFLVSKDGSGVLGALLPGDTPALYRPRPGARTPDFDPWLCAVPAMIAPLMANDRLVGMFYADNAPAGAEPSPDQLTAFSHFAQHAQLCITLLSAR